jgi:autotransporter-associated beta strand protein
LVAGAFSSSFSLSLSPDQASIRIVAPGGSNSYSVLTITAITVNGGEGDDRLTVDFANGNPVPAGGVTCDGQGGRDGVRVVATGSNATLTGEQVTVGTAAPIGFSNTEGTSFDLGTGRLTKNGSGTAVLVGSSIYAGGTEVLGGTLAVGHANALPAGGGLTIGAGATVVLARGLDQAAAGDRRIAVSPAPAGSGPWQLDRGQSTVHCLQSTVHGPLPTCVPGSEPASARKAPASLSSSPLWPGQARRTTGTQERAPNSQIRPAGVQRWQELAGLLAGPQIVRRKAPLPRAVDQVLAALS